MEPYLPTSLPAPMLHGGDTSLRPHGGAIGQFSLADNGDARPIGCLQRDAEPCGPAADHQQVMNMAL